MEASSGPYGAWLLVKLAVTKHGRVHSAPFSVKGAGESSPPMHAPCPCTPPRFGYTGTPSMMLYWAAVGTRVGFGDEKRKILVLPLQDLDLLPKTLSMVGSITGLCSGSSDDV
jgi:hypothetical protein